MRRRMMMIGIEGVEVDSGLGIGGDLVYLILAMTYLDDMMDARYRDTNRKDLLPYAV
jgi:hypothetical protein